MENNLPKKRLDRRNSADKWVHLSRIVAILSWLFFILAMVVSFYAAPEDDYGLLRHKNITIRDYWLKPLTGYLYITLWLSALFSFISLLISYFRSRRVQDSKMYNLVLLIITTIAWIVYIYTQAQY